MSEDKGPAPIPAQFWASFGDDFTDERVLGEGRRIRRYADGRVTFEDWLKGDFQVDTPRADGSVTSQRVEGVMFRREDVMKLWPPSE